LVHDVNGNIAVHIRQKGDDQGRAAEGPILLARRFFDDIKAPRQQGRLDAGNSRPAIRQQAHALGEKALRHIAASWSRSVAAIEMVVSKMI
jgi:hypothetical protein